MEFNDIHDSVKSPNDKLWVCKLCQKQFCKRSSLLRHHQSKTHRELKNHMKPFECPCCELKFAEPRNVTNHIKRAHQTIAPISGVIRITGNFQCPLCSEHDSENFESFKNHLFSSHVPSDEEEKVGRITDKIIKIYIITNYNFRSPAIFVRSLLQWERTSWITSSPPIWAVRCNATTVSSRIQVPVE